MTPRRKWFFSHKHAIRNKCKIGEREIREGPAVIYLHYNEQVETISRVHILDKNQAIRLKALQDFDDKKAGTVWQVRGTNYCRIQLIN
jgi:hypothetical protein